MTRIGRVLAGTAAVAAIAGTFIIPASTAGASATGTPIAGALALSPAIQATAATPFTLSLPSGNNFCPQSTAGPFNARWQGFIAPTSIDPVTLTFNNLGPTNPGAFPLYSTGAGDLMVNRDTDTVGGFIGLTSYNLATVAIPAGTYNMGYACTSGGIISDFTATPTSFGPAANVGKSATWTVPVTVNAAGAYSFGVVPAKPVLATPTYDAATTTATVNFTPPTPPTPVLLDYTATLVPVGGATAISPITVSAAATSFSVPNVLLGSSYTVTLRARNATGLSVASDPQTITGAVNSASPVVTAPDAFEGNTVTVTWTAPTSPTTPAPASYNVAITPGGPSFTGVTGLSQVIPAGLAIGSYTATVTPVYAAGSGVTGVAGFDPFAITPNTLITQQITVTRPPGAIILTQRCGVYGPLDPFVGVDTFPGFPVRPATPGAWTGTLAALNPSIDQVGTSPTVINPATGLPVVTNYPTPGGTGDPEFPNYPEPSPVTYPTQCGLTMGTARFVTSGALAGQFYTATGRLNQVTVLDTRDTDTGWIARGDIADTFGGTSFLGNTGVSFNGDYLGWAPQVSKTSDPITGSGGYDQIVTAGPAVLPGSNVTVANRGSQIGMTENPVLSSSLANQGLGIASMDARMNLLIPASADAANYSALLSLTVVARP